MTKANSTEIVFVVDRSGSMQKIAADMIGGYKNLIEEQRKEDGKCFVTLARFDDKYELVFEGMPIAEVPDLELVPRGMTALLDSIGRTINSVSARIAAMKPKDRPTQIMFVIITDGQENSSKEFTRSQVFDLITKHSATGFQFIFLGANQDAIAAAKDLGIQASHSATYHYSTGGAAAAFSSTSSNMKRMRRGLDLEDMQLSYNAAFDGANQTMATQATVVTPTTTVSTSDQVGTAGQTTTKTTTT